MLICSSELRHHVALYLHEEDEETFCDKSKPSESLHCWHRCGTHEHEGLCRRASPLGAGMDDSTPGQSTAGVPAWRRDRLEA